MSARRAKEQRRAAAGDPEAWGSWESATMPPDGAAQLAAAGWDPECYRVYINAVYQVIVRRLLVPDLVADGRRARDAFHLSIKRRDKRVIRDWRDLQRIKNELIDPEAEAVELYPADSRLTDEANQFHLWVFVGGGFSFPFGYRERLVTDDTPRGAARQRTFRAEDLAPRRAGLELPGLETRAHPRGAGSPRRTCCRSSAVADAFCPSCRALVRWRAGTSSRLADRRCQTCGGPLLGSSSRVAREFKFEEYAAATVERVQLAAASADDAQAHSAYFAVRTLADWAFQLWPDLRGVDVPQPRRAWPYQR